MNEAIFAHIQAKLIQEIAGDTTQSWDLNFKL